MSSIKGIIFDYGGTIDTNGIHWGELIWEEYRNAGIRITREEYREAYVHAERTLAKNPIIGTSDTFSMLLLKKLIIQAEFLNDKAIHAPSLTIDLDDVCEIADACYERTRKTIAVTRPILEKLGKERPMVLVTNFYGNMPVVLKEFGLDHLFGSIIESSVVGLRKPDPALFALGVKAVGVPAENIIVIGDSYRKDIYPSSTLGCKTAWLKKVCWSDESIEEGHKPTAIISSLEELPAIIEKTT